MKPVCTAIAILLDAAAQPTFAATTVCEAVWTDASRQRAVPVRMRLPQGISRAPVVVFSHGLGGTYAAGTDWAEAWADAGIATIHVQHPGSDENLWKSATGPANRLAALRSGASGVQLVARIADVRFVIDELARRPAEVMTGGCRIAAIDTTRFGMAGHSFGAVTTQALAGQRFASGATASDPRIKAAIAFSPSPSRQLPDAESFGAIIIPFMSVTGTADTVPMLDRTPAADRTRPYAAMPAGGKYLLVFDGADHAIFNGHRLRRAAAPGDAHVKATVSAATTDFWRSHLLGDAGARKRLDGPSPIKGIAANDKFSKK